VPQISHHFTSNDDPESEIFVTLYYRNYPRLHATHTDPESGGPEAESMTVDNENVELFSPRWEPLTDKMLSMIGDEAETELEAAVNRWEYIFDNLEPR